jgi:hypothetical protein
MEKLLFLVTKARDEKQQVTIEVLFVCWLFCLDISKMTEFCMYFSEIYRQSGGKKFSEVLDDFAFSYTLYLRLHGWYRTVRRRIIESCENCSSEMKEYFFTVSRNATCMWYKRYMMGAFGLSNRCNLLCTYFL